MRLRGDIARRRTRVDDLAVDGNRAIEVACGFLIVNTFLQEFGGGLRAERKRHQHERHDAVSLHKPRVQIGCYRIVTPVSFLIGAAAYFPRRRKAAEVTFSGVKPKFFMISSPGADAP